MPSSPGILALFLLPQALARSALILFTVLSEFARGAFMSEPAHDWFEDDRYSEEVITFLTMNSQS